MSVRSLNWLKFGGLVGLAFVLGLMFAGLLDLPKRSVAQDATAPATPVVPTVQTALPPTATSSLTALSDAFATVAEAVRPSVVFIRSQRTEREQSRRVPPGFEDFFGFRQRGRNEPQVETGSGSGFIVSADGYILTNNHVVDGADEVTVRLFDRHEFTAKVVGSDAATDVAVIKISVRGTSLTPAKLGSSAATRVGEWVLAVGNPLQEQLNFTVTSGIVSAKGRGQLSLPGPADGRGIQDFIQTDAAINRGNSGGPLLNVRGEVIGINSAIFSQTGFSVGYAFAVPIDLAKTVMEQLISKGKVERAALGVYVAEATDEDAEYVKLPDIRGVRVNEFSADDSPAKSAGIQQGDIIIAINGQPVEYVAQLQQLVGFKKPGEVVKVEVARKGGVRRTYDVRLVAQNPAQLARADRPDSGQAEDDASGDVKERLGVTVSGVSPEVAERMGLRPGTRGVLVEAVDPYGPADGLLAPGGTDLITAVEGKAIRTESDLRSELRAYRAGDIISLTVFNPELNGGRGASRIVRIKVAGKRP
jgi:serine protease Do